MRFVCGCVCVCVVFHAASAFMRAAYTSHMRANTHACSVRACVRVCVCAFSQSRLLDFHVLGSLVSADGCTLVDVVLLYTY